MIRFGALLALALATAPPDAAGRVVESAAEVAQALGRLRAVRPEAAASVPRRVYVVVSALTPERRGLLEAAGLSIELPAPGGPPLRWRAGEVVQGTAAPGALAALARLPFVLALETPGEPIASAGAVTTAGDTIHLSATARAVLASDGAGVTVGVISDGADRRSASVASGDLPADVAVPAIPGVGAGAGDEGTALLEIVHDVAPGAQLLFAGPRTSAAMVAAIDGLAAAGARVIVDDLVFTDEPKFEDGPIALAAQRFAAGGGVYVTSAGNSAETHWLGRYRPGGRRSLAGTAYRAVHAFRGGDFGNSLVVPPGVQLIAVLQWSNRFGRAADDLDLVLVREGGAALAVSDVVQAGAGNPIEALRWTNGSGSTVRAALAVAEFARITPAASLRLDLHVFSRVRLPLEYVTRRDSIFGHAAVEEVLSVAAVPAAAPGAVEVFSSQGPATILFPARLVRAVPRLAAVDGVETAVGRRGQFANPFFGTSAAAPHVAGCAALLLAAGASGGVATSALVATALDLGPDGFDDAAGAGLLDCAAAARLASGRRAAPAVEVLAADFEPTGAVRIGARGTDPDADVRRAAVVLRDRYGAELARTGAALAQAGTAFTLEAVVRAPVLARVRAAAALVTDATGLGGGRTAALACPRDASLGDALCALGDLLDRLAVVPGRRGRRLERLAEGAAAALDRAGEATLAGRRARVRHALGTAASRLGAVARGARHRLAPDLQGPILEDATALRGRVLALRASFT